MEPTCFYWQHPKLGLLLGIGERAVILQSIDVGLNELQDFLNLHKGQYIFGYLSFDVKNTFENLDSTNPDDLEFPLIHFWVPESIFQLDSSLALLWAIPAPKTGTKQQLSWKNFSARKVL